MKKIILFITIASVHLTARSQYSPEVSTMSLHNSCATAAKVCLQKHIVTTSTPWRERCEDSLTPQYFKFDMGDSGAISLQTFAHTGTYALYGPMASTGLTACEQISLGQVNQVGGPLSGGIGLAHGEGHYILMVNPTNCIGVGDDYKVDIRVSAKKAVCVEEPPCVDCLSSFSPEPGRYLISAWVKGEEQNKNSSYENPGIAVSFQGATDSSYFSPSGLIIDGWQRIDGVVDVPVSATGINIGLYCSSGECLFDDVRFTPMEAMMISYVYDPMSFKLIAQLDGRNYATFYEYDEQGKLIRTKRETERGIMTMQEIRENTYTK